MKNKDGSSLVKREHIALIITIIVAAAAILVVLFATGTIDTPDILGAKTQATTSE